MRTIAELYKAIADIDNRIRKYNCADGVDTLETPEKNELKLIGKILKKAGYIITGKGNAVKGKDNSGADVKLEDILKYFNSPDLKKEEYYHYTDLNGLLGIFKSYIDSDLDKVETCTMRASHLRFLNDSQEYVEGRNRYKTYIQDFNQCVKDYKALKDYLDSDGKEQPKVSDKLSSLKQGKENLVKAEPVATDGDKDDAKRDESVYSISFCGEGDLLSQWKYYGKNSGIAIEFNFKDAECFIGDALVSEDGSVIAAEYGKTPTTYDVCPLKIAYTDIEKLVLFAMSCLQPSNNGSTIVAGGPNPDILIPFCKNEAFKEERESRMVFAPDNVKCKYVVSDGKIKPYIPITFLTKKGANIIKSITVGPGENQNLVYNALIHIFDSKKFRFQEDNGNQSIASKNMPYPCQNGVKIKKSEIPFRG